MFCPRTVWPSGWSCACNAGGQLKLPYDTEKSGLIHFWPLRNIYKPADPSTQPSVLFGGAEIKPRGSTKHLGVYLDDSLTFHTHTDDAVVEEQRWNALRVFQSKVHVDSREDALALALEWTDRSGTVWRMPGLALFGFQGEEAELEEIELVASEEGSGSDNEEDGPGPP